jgi:transcriptional regulator with XRE-family HTH domain
MSISNNLKALRAQRGLTQGQLAEMASIELTQVSRIERAASEPKLETIKKLAIALQCTTDELIMDAGHERGDPKYIKVILKRINNLTPLKRFVLIDMLQSYLNQNEVQEPSIREQFGHNLTETDYTVAIDENYRTELANEEELVASLSNDIESERILRERK